MAKNVGLAAQLAKQAAQAAREEVSTSSAGRKAKADSGWTPPALPLDFDVDRAITRAATKVAAHYRQILAPEGLNVAVVTDGLQGVEDFRADLREKGTDRVLKAYTAGDLLAMYAGQQRRTGVVVDGQV